MSPGVVSSNSIRLVAEDAVKVTMFGIQLSGVPWPSAVTVSTGEPFTVTLMVWLLPGLSSPLTADEKDSEYSSPGVVATSW